MSDMPVGSLLYLDDWRGVNIPRDFVDTTYRECISGVKQEDLDACSDPDGEWYWEAWDTVCRNAVITDNAGNKFTLYQDGALWLIPVGAEWSED